ncbi:homing endonuclease [Salmonella phage vB_SnwM_CGG4-1]|uniref:Homing endonuclease n=1 Tax=Salmonella phage vB_SnwM_CGG4-1 TaxID=1815631 RepID=A0A1B0VW11_9CAUD|nr:homing endonuclease [Salmonella phage vB_SnwM_CGG4-1]ANA49514.1 homing endonuclease [Salmonella phage vB_SnwM_CGG4-1]
MYYLIYQIQNNINKKIYIGAHATTNINDSYMGSGVNIVKSIAKYGVENFTKQILFIFKTSEEMYKKEAEIVNEEFVLRRDTYNAALGGRGNPVIIHLQNPSYRKMISDKTKAGMTKEVKERISKSKKGISQSKELVEKRVRSWKAYYENNEHHHKGKKWSKEHKRKIGDAQRGIIKLVPVHIKGIDFDNPKYAAKHFNVSDKTIRNWINNPSINDCFKK